MRVNPAVCAVVVSFHPDAEVKQNLRALVREFGHILIVDNGSLPAAQAMLAGESDVTLIALGENLGVAAALNRGAEWARQRGYQWMVTFDQDSRPSPGFAAGLWEAHLRYPEAAIIAPCLLEEATVPHRGYRWVRRHGTWPMFYERVSCHDEDLRRVTVVITSGSLMALEVWAELGGFAENLFIDYVDVDYCLRVGRTGREIVVAAHAFLHHKLGARKTGRVLGKDLRPTHHAAFRHFYIARNRVAVWRRHALATPHWALFDLAYAFFNGFRVIALESDKWSKVKAMVVGTWDGLCGRTGPCPESRLRMFRT